jgi:hypothetical protein
MRKRYGAARNRLFAHTVGGPSLWLRIHESQPTLRRFVDGRIDILGRKRDARQRLQGQSAATSGTD